MRRIGFAVLMVLVMAMLGGCSNANTVGIVDTNKVMTDSAKVKEIREKMMSLEADLSKQQATVSKEEMQAKQAAAEVEVTKMQQDFKAQFEKAVDEVAKEKKLSVVLHKGGVATGGIDVTDDVVKKLQ